MLLTSNELVAELIIRLLAQRPAQSIEQIHRHAQEAGGAVSIKAIYKGVRQLQKAGVVVSAKRAHTLNLNWLLQMEGLIQGAYEHACSSFFSSRLLSGQAARSRWHFTSLERLDDFAVQLLTLMAQSSNGKLLYSWVIHPWFALIHSSKEQRFQSAMKNLGIQQRLLVEQDTALARSITKIYGSGTIRVQFGRAKLHVPSSTSFIAAIGDLVLHERLNLTAERDIHSLFKSTRNPKEVDPVSVLRVFRQSTSASLILERNQRKVAAISRKLEPFFV